MYLPVRLLKGNYNTYKYYKLKESISYLAMKSTRVRQVGVQITDWAQQNLHLQSASKYAWESRYTLPRSLGSCVLKSTNQAFNHNLKMVPNPNVVILGSQGVGTAGFTGADIF